METCVDRRHAARMRWTWMIAVLALAGSSRADEAPSCGAPGKPPCPLQQWMRVNMAAPMAKGKNEELAEAFDALVAMNPRPKEWHNWNKFAKDGAAAARAGKEHTAESACGHCHRVYRREYNARYRERGVE